MRVQARLRACTCLFVPPPAAPGLSRSTTARVNIWDDESFTSEGDRLPGCQRLARGCESADAPCDLPPNARAFALVFAIHLFLLIFGRLDIPSDKVPARSRRVTFGKQNEMAIKRRL